MVAPIRSSRPQKANRRLKKVLPKSDHERAIGVDEINGPAVLMVLGMHRSGTSAVAGVLSKLGCQIPKHVLPANSANERGYFESAALMELHEDLLESAGSYWHDWRRFNPDWYSAPTSEAFKQRAKDIFLSEYPNASLAVLKDPRICRFVPFWIDVFGEMSIAPRALIPIRSPLEVAYSLKKRDAMSVTKGLLLWLRHVLDAELMTRGISRAIFSWDQFLTDWRVVADRISAEINIAWPRLSDRSSLEIDRFLDSSLVHNRLGQNELSSHPNVHEWTVAAYEALLELSLNPMSNSANAALDEIRKQFERASSLFGSALIDYESSWDELSAEINSRRDELEHLHARCEHLSSDLATARDETLQFSGQAATASEERQRLAAELERRRAEIQQLTADLSNRAKQQDAVNAQLLETENANSALQMKATAQHADLLAGIEERSRLAKELERLELALSEATAAQSDLIARVEEFARQFAEAAREKAALADELALYKAKFAASFEERSRLTEELQRSELALSEATAAQSDLLARVEQSEMRLAEVAVEKAKLADQLIGDEAKLAASAEERSRLAKELERLELALSEATAAQSDLLARVEQSEMRLAEAAAKRSELVGQLMADEAKLAASAEECSRLTEELQRLELALTEAMAARSDLLARAEQSEMGLAEAVIEKAELVLKLKDEGDRQAASVEERSRLTEKLQHLELALSEANVAQSELLERAERSERRLAEAAVERTQLAGKMIADEAKLATIEEERSLLAEELQRLQVTLSGANVAQTELLARAEQFERQLAQALLEKIALTDKLTADEAELTARLEERARLAEALSDRETLLAAAEDELTKRAAALVQVKKEKEEIVADAQAEIRCLNGKLLDMEIRLAQSDAKLRNLSKWGKLIQWRDGSRKIERRLINEGVFDANWYVGEYGHLLTNGYSPVRHYVEQGWLKGFFPNAFFDTRWYLTKYDDVRHSGMNPLLHYIEYGAHEGRDPSPAFQTGFYLMAYPEVRVSRMNPLAHYLRQGRQQGLLCVKPGTADGDILRINDSQSFNDRI